MINFIKENIWVVIFVFLTVVGIIAILDEKKNILERIKSKVLI